jgi:hypothetical protein
LGFDAALPILLPKERIFRVVVIDFQELTRIEGVLCVPLVQGSFSFLMGLIRFKHRVVFDIVPEFSVGQVNHTIFGFIWTVFRPLEAGGCVDWRT